MSFSQIMSMISKGSESRNIPPASGTSSLLSSNGKTDGNRSITVSTAFKSGSIAGPVTGSKTGLGVNKVEVGPGSGSKSSGRPSVSAKVQYQLSAQEQEEQRQRVMRLKADRLQSKPASPKSLSAKSSIKSSTKSSTRTTGAKTSSTSSRPRQSSNPKIPTTRTAQQTEQPRSPKKKLNFKEIMAQAEKIDKDKLKLTVKVKPKPSKGQSLPDQSSPLSSSYAHPSSQSPGHVRRQRSLTPNFESANRSRTEGPITSRSRSVVNHKQTLSKIPISAPAPGSKSASNSSGIAQPSSRTPSVSGPRTPAPFSKPTDKLLEKQRRRRAQQEEEEEYESLDEFIVDDENEPYINSTKRSRGEEMGYDRDEIWSIFNRGRQRRDFVDSDGDLSDMEATGADVLFEEQRSAWHGRKEDEEEEKELLRRAEMKKQRKL